MENTLFSAFIADKVNGVVPMDTTFSEYENFAAVVAVQPKYGSHKKAMSIGAGIGAGLGTAGSAIDLIGKAASSAEGQEASRNLLEKISEGVGTAVGSVPGVLLSPFVPSVGAPATVAGGFLGNKFGEKVAEGINSLRDTASEAAGKTVLGGLPEFGLNTAALSLVGAGVGGLANKLRNDAIKKKVLESNKSANFSIFGGKKSKEVSNEVKSPNNKVSTEERDGGAGFLKRATQGITALKGKGYKENTKRGFQAALSAYMPGYVAKNAGVSKEQVKQALKNELNNSKYGPIKPE